MHDHKHRWYVKGANLWSCKCGRIGYYRLGPDRLPEWVERRLRDVAAADVARERTAYLEVLTT